MSWPPTRTGNRQKPDVIPTKELNDPAHLMLSPEEGRRLHGQVVWSGRERPDRREVGRQIGMEQLKDPLRLQQVTQPVFTQVT